METVGITVTDPEGGEGADPGPLTVLMADSSDRRHTYFLDPTGRPGEWRGRFTPMLVGRYTGTALLARGERKEIGLVPLIRVRRSSRRGFLRLSPTSPRVLQYGAGDPFFPVGLRLDPQSLHAGIDWAREFRTLRAHGVNYLEVPVEWPAGLSAAAQAESQETVDRLLLLAERSDRFGIQLRLDAPDDLSSPSVGDYEAQLQRWVRRWSHSPALAVWHVAGAGESFSPQERARMVRIVRSSDSYGHLVAVPGSDESARAGADLLITPLSLERPAPPRSILTLEEAQVSAAPLPGETSWQMLAAGGIGLPLRTYLPGSPGAPALLDRMAALARAARSIPYQLAPAPVPGAVAVDSPGGVYRYGRVWAGWVAPDPGQPLRLPGLPRGRYRVSLWDPARDTHLSDTLLWSEGGEARVELPSNLQSVFLQLAAIPGAAPRARTGVSGLAAPPRRTARPAPRTKRPPRRMTARERRIAAHKARVQAQYDRAQRDLRRRLAKRARFEAKSRRAAAAAPKKTPRQLRAEKRAAALAAKKAAKTRKTVKKPRPKRSAAAKPSPRQTRKAKAAAAAAAKKKAAAKKAAARKTAARKAAARKTKSKKPAPKSKRRR
jgi:hypothetical protein